MDSKIIGKRIKELRNIKHLTQKELAKLANFSGSISELENGKYLPSAETLLVISKALDCSIEWILTGEDRISEKNTRPAISEILSSLEQLSDEYLLDVKKFISYKLYEQKESEGLSSTSTHGKQNIKNEIIA